MKLKWIEPGKWRNFIEFNTMLTFDKTLDILEALLIQTIVRIRLGGKSKKIKH